MPNQLDFGTRLHAAEASSGPQESNSMTREKEILEIEEHADAPAQPLKSIEGEPPQTASPAPPGKSRRRLVMLITLIALAGGGALFALFNRAGRAPQSKSAKPAAESATPSDMVVPTQAQLLQLTVEPVGQRTVTEDHETTGKVAFNEDRLTPVFTPYAGRVVEVLAAKGAVVRAGQPLLVIESPDLVAALNDLSAARSDADKARIALGIAEKAAERARRLNEREALATKDLQQAEADLRRAVEELRRADAAVMIAESKLALFGKSADEIKRVSGQSSALNAIDRRVIIRAPIGGTVVERKVGPGQYVKSDLPDPMFLISDLSTLWVQADVYESDLAAVRAGEAVTVSVDAYPGRTFPARISFISPTVDPTTRTVRVRVVVPNAGGLLKPDMFAKIKISGAARRVVPVVPAGAIVAEGGTTFAFVEELSGHFRKRQVQVAAEQHGQAVVTSGLQAGERVVTRGALLLKG
jgi:cobalt-zinc-cadmium efflux system membrane fusion protein